MLDLTYDDVVRKADHIKALHSAMDAVHINPNGAPFEKATAFEPGGLHRCGIPVSGWFEAQENGIRIRWSFDLEPRSANGMHGIQPDSDAVRAVMRKLQGRARQQFREWLSATAAAMRAEATKTQEWCDQQVVAARVISDLAYEAA